MVDTSSNIRQITQVHSMLKRLFHVIYSVSILQNIDYTTEHNLTIQQQHTEQYTGGKV